MNRSSKKSWFDSLVEYSPLLALFMSFVSIAGKAGKIENPHIWLVGLMALPAFVAVLWSGLIVYRRGKSD